MNGLETYLGGSATLSVAAAFAAGILTGFSPCVYPMYPIVSAYAIARTAAEASRLRAVLHSVGYVVGMATVYAFLGMLAALTGSMFGRISTSPWSLLIVANLLILFALNMLDVVPFPAWLTGQSREPSAGGIAGAFLLGAASGLVASPCTTPVLLALLTFVATGHSVVYGAVLLFSFSLGMGMPLIAVGTCSGWAAALPRPGRWMVAVRKLLALLMLGMGEYYLIRAGQAWF